jgi:hypothetical protein
MKNEPKFKKEQSSKVAEAQRLFELCGYAPMWLCNWYL